MGGHNNLGDTDMVQFTAHEVWAFVIASIGMILTLLNIVDKWATIRQRKKEPEDEQNRRISELEKEVGKIKTRLSNDRKMIDDLQNTNALLVKGVLALLEIQARSEDSDKVNAIQAEMQHFLITKGLNYEKAENAE